MIALQNAAVLALLALAVLLVRLASGREPWSGAWRHLRGNRLAVASLAILAVYVAVGVVDSLAWHDPVRDAAGTVLRDDHGAVVLEPVPLTLLDRVLAPLRLHREKTYSAPFAARAHVNETLVQPDGRKLRDRPPLRYPRAHPLGTDRIGNDVLYLALKGVRTGLVIGGLTTLLIVPLALLFGLSAGYWGGRVDDAVQYAYTTLESIPDVLLIAAFILIFGRGLPQLCLIMGITSWTTLCRLVRAETLKLRELEYVEAARALGVSDGRILLRHILPNVMHIVVITFVLRFSGLVLTEAVLSYLNLGVDPGTGSWGHMINAARQELSREPVVWWNLASSLAFMIGLVLPANLFGDALRDALDPRLRTR